MILLFKTLMPRYIFDELHFDITDTCLKGALVLIGLRTMNLRECIETWTCVGLEATPSQ